MRSREAGDHVAQVAVVSQPHRRVGLESHFRHDVARLVEDAAAQPHELPQMEVGADRVPVPGQLQVRLDHPVDVVEAGRVELQRQEPVAAAHSERAEPNRRLGTDPDRAGARAHREADGLTPRRRRPERQASRRDRQAACPEHDSGGSDPRPCVHFALLRLGSRPMLSWFAFRDLLGPARRPCLRKITWLRVRRGGRPDLPRNTSPSLTSSAKPSHDDLVRRRGLSVTASHAVPPPLGGDGALNSQPDAD